MNKLNVFMLGVIVGSNLVRIYTNYTDPLPWTCLIGGMLMFVSCDSCE